VQASHAFLNGKRAKGLSRPQLVALALTPRLRAEHAVQRKLDAIAAALLEQRERETREAHAGLEEAIGMHEEV
jgi:hypothetical protein